MQVTSLISEAEQHEHGDDCGCGHDHEHSVVHLWQTIAGVVFVLNAYVVDWLFQQGSTVASASAMIGAIILGYPIIVTAVKDLRRGRLSINELVAIAVLAAFVWRAGGRGSRCFNSVLPWRSWPSGSWWAIRSRRTHVTAAVKWRNCARKCGTRGNW